MKKLLFILLLTPLWVNAEHLIYNKVIVEDEVQCTEDCTMFTQYENHGYAEIADSMISIGDDHYWIMNKAEESYNCVKLCSGERFTIEPVYSRRKLIGILVHNSARIIAYVRY